MTKNQFRISIVGIMETVYHHFDTIDSTRTWAKAHAKELKPEVLTVISAKEQTMGQGKFDRQWHSSHGANILCTACLFRKLDASISLMWALSIISVIETLGLKPGFKWPNDLHINGKKLGGILCDVVPVGQKTLNLFHVGLNVNMTEDQAAQIDQRATSLFIETGQTFIPEQILNTIIETFCSNLPLFQQKGMKAFIEDFRRLISLKKGQKVRLNNYRQVWEGLFHSISDDGSLNLEILPLREIHTFFAGEIF